MNAYSRIHPSVVLGSLTLALAAFACGEEPPKPPVAPVPTAQPPATVSASIAPEPETPINYAAIPRPEFNRLALLHAVPVFWVQDADNDGKIEPGELATYWGLREVAKNEFVDGGQFTRAFRDAYRKLAASHQGGDHLAVPESDRARVEILEQELAQGRQTLVQTDLSSASAAEKSFVKHLVAAATVAERLYQRQMGTYDIPRAKDTASQALFFRNQNPKCAAPKTQSNPGCFASEKPVTGKPSGLYEPAFLKQEKFCETLSKSGDKALMDPFTVVIGDPASPRAVPYTDFYKADMALVAKELSQAADDLKDTKEAALREYLQAAAKSFTDNQWWPADEAWARMGVDNSKYYVRIAPDEVYAEPCSTKALFHVSFGLINQGSRAFQAKLSPLKSEMEKAIADLAGKPYVAREVTFKLPDFVDIGLNSGDSRPPFGATIGQSLPNFGPVANQGRGRTVAMTNFYTDPDSLAAQKGTASSLFCKKTMEQFTTDPAPGLMSTVLHEAAHNLGPAHQYKVDGKTDREVFGGPLASTLEEFKAQTAAMFYGEWLVSKKQLTRAEVDQAHVRDVFWGFGHISRGMYDEDHHPKNYSQLAAMQFGSFVKDKAVVWNAKETAANGTDVGCYEVKLDKMPTSIKKLMKVAAEIKGKGDKKRAEKLVAEFVDAGGATKEHLERIRERVLRAPKPSFIYSIKLD